MKKKLTQTQIKERQEKTKKIKSLLIRSLNIVCYCLSVLFIIMAIAIGAQSCSNKNKSETESAAISPLSKIQYRLDNDSLTIDDFNYLYTSKFNGYVTLETSVLQPLLDAYDLPATKSSADFNTYSERWYFDNPIYILDDTEITPVIFANVSFDYVAVGIQYFARFKWVEFYYANAQSYLLGRSSPTDDNKFRAYFTTENVYLLASSALVDDVFTDFFLNTSTINPTSFTFNAQINYNATFDGVFESPFLNIGQTGETYIVNKDIGWFYSGGKFFNQIIFTWFNARNVEFVMSDGETRSKVASDIFEYQYFSHMEYFNSLTGDRVFVNRRNSFPYEHSGIIDYYVDNSSTWVSSNYQTITLLTDTSEINITNLNKYNNTTAGGSITTGGNIGLQNGFTLLGSAFSSILPFLAIQVLPGLSIGLLLFIPLIVIIIILVFKVVKK